MVSMTDGEVFLIRTSDRGFGIRNLLQRFDLNSYSGKRRALKANYNSADPFPASTHLETLETLVRSLKEAGTSELTLAERSGMGDTRKVLKECGIFDLSEKLDFKVVVLDEQEKDHWVKISRDQTHWPEGFQLSKVFLEADRVVQTCCLKTHRFGSHFTLSLKKLRRLNRGPSSRRSPRLHARTAQLSPPKTDIAEINTTYRVDLVIMDAKKAFITQGPERGDTVEPNLLLASNDRVAIDAVGVAILRDYPSTPDVMRGRIFQLDHIRRAAELGVGVQSASNIKLTPVNNESLDDAKKIEQILKSQG